MKFPPAFRNVKTRFQTRETARRAVAARANDALNHSKRAIFALHREDPAEAARLLAHANQQFEKCESLFRTFPDLRHEGAYNAALEEHAEALIFSGYLEHGTIKPLEKRLMEPGVYLAGLSDATGEMVRYAMRQAIKGNIKVVEDTTETVEMIITFLLDLDLTGYLRTKFDQAKKNLRSLEQMLYDVRT